MKLKVLTLYDFWDINQIRNTEVKYEENKDVLTTDTNDKIFDNDFIIKDDEDNQDTGINDNNMKIRTWNDWKHSRWNNMLINLNLYYLT